MSEQQKHDTKFWIGFFIGGLLGAITLFFLGTKEGKKTGKLLEKKGSDLLDDLEKRIEELESKGKELVQRGEEMKNQVVEQLAERKDELTKDVTDRLDSALEHIEKLQEEGVEVTRSIRKKFFRNIPKKSH